MKIDGEFLTNLCFADDIDSYAQKHHNSYNRCYKNYPKKLGELVLRIMNIAKTILMVVDNTPINVNNVLIENVEGYVYLGQHYSLKEKNQDKEIQRRIMAGWAAYAKHRDIFHKQPCHLLEETGVQLPCAAISMTYMVQRPGTLTKQAQNKLAAADTKMERSKLNFTYKDRKTNIWVRERTKVIYTSIL